MVKGTLSPDHLLSGKELSRRLNERSRWSLKRTTLISQ